jgi:competence protein ComEC
MTMRAVLVTSLLAIAGLATAPGHASPATGKVLQIYFIDVEGGQSTLVVTPDRRSLLIDTGWAGDGTGFRPGDPRQARDANRILAAARDAGLTQIDELLITHFHSDHDGGVKELAQLIPIAMFIDHGAPSDGAVSTSADTAAAFRTYVEVRGDKRHIEPRLTDHLPLDDIEAIVVSTAGTTLADPLPQGGGANALCQAQPTPSLDPYENPRSTGLVIRFGKFRFLDLGDLAGTPLYALACPRDMVGPVSIYLVSHHGGGDQGDLGIFAAFRPRVAVMNNGVKKGGARTTYQALHHVPGLEDVWQLHASADAADANFAAAYIANLDESTAFWIKVVAKSDGSFRLENPRTGEWHSYQASSR